MYILAYTLWQFHRAIENDHRNSGFSHSKFVIFHSYLSHYQRDLCLRLWNNRWRSTFPSMVSRTKICSTEKKLSLTVESNFNGWYGKWSSTLGRETILKFSCFLHLATCFPHAFFMLSTSFTRNSDHCWMIFPCPLVRSHNERFLPQEGGRPTLRQQEGQARDTQHGEKAGEVQRKRWIFWDLRLRKDQRLTVDIILSCQIDG